MGDSLKVIFVVILVIGVLGQCVSCTDTRTSEEKFRDEYNKRKEIERYEKERQEYKTRQALIDSAYDARNKR